MTVQIGAKPDSGFDDPLGMLQDCHRRIEKFLGILCRVVAGRTSGKLSDEEKAAVATAVRYFEEGGRRHNDDEEQSLFPRLRGKAAPDADSLERLEKDHRDADFLHQSVARLYAGWLASDSISPADRQSLLSATERLKQMYDAHIQLEENVVFPRAAHCLSSGVLREIGEEFRERRIGASA